jgi:hypothetical protein
MLDFVNYLSEKYSETHSISLMNLAEKAWEYTTQKQQSSGLSQTDAQSFADNLIKSDYCDGFKKRDIPPFMKKYAHDQKVMKLSKSLLNERQLHHQKD